MTVDRETGEIVEASLPIDQIIVGERARKDYGDLSELVESIDEHGLLEPIGVLPGDRLLFGGRRLEACKKLGMTTIPITRPRTRDDALALVRAERDENTCRKDMTPEELVDVGMRIEELERPKAEARQADGQRHGGFARHGSASTSVDTEAAKPQPNPTANTVGKALGISSAHYQRAKNVVQTARGENDPTPEVQQVARKALDAMNNGTSVSTAYNKVRAARKPVARPSQASANESHPDQEELNNLTKSPKSAQRATPHATQLENIAATATVWRSHILPAITELDESITSEKAAAIHSDLSKAINELNRIKRLLKERTS